MHIEGCVLNNLIKISIFLKTSVTFGFVGSISHKPEISVNNLESEFNELF